MTHSIIKSQANTFPALKHSPYARLQKQLDLHSLPKATNSVLFTRGQLGELRRESPSWASFRELNAQTCCRWVQIYWLPWGERGLETTLLALLVGFLVRDEMASVSPGDDVHSMPVLQDV